MGYMTLVYQGTERISVCDLCDYRFYPTGYDLYMAQGTAILLCYVFMLDNTNRTVENVLFSFQNVYF